MTAAAVDPAAAAGELAPRLRASAAANARRGVHDQPTHAALRDGGVYAMLVPRRFGGAGLGLVDLAPVLAELAAACPATARAVAELAAGALRIGASFGEQAQAELHSRRPARAASALDGTLRARRRGDGWTLAGTLRYGAAARHATHLIAPAADGETGLVAIVATAAVTLADDGAVRIDGVHVAERFAVATADLPAPDPYTTSILPAALAAVLAGAARGAAAEVQAELDRDPLRAQDADWQRWLGAAIAHALTAELLLREALARPGEPLRIAMLARESMGYGWSAIEVVLRNAGTLPAAPRDAIERIGAAALRILHDPALPSAESLSRLVARDRLGLA